MSTGFPHQELIQDPETRIHQDFGASCRGGRGSRLSLANDVLNVIYSSIYLPVYLCIYLPVMDLY